MLQDHNQDPDLSYHRYEGNKIPRLIRLSWTLLVIFAVIYLALYAWPDLREWLKS